VNRPSTIIAPALDEPPALRNTISQRLDSVFAFASKFAKSRVRLGLGVLFLFALVFIVYCPILPGSFLMDDHRLIKDDNALVNGQFTPLNIWFQTDFTLSTFALWLQWLAWGENPGGYHVVNMALQAVSAVLLWRLLAQLKIPGAWVVAAVFAVHPVCVNSVARIAEIKNTLSLPFFILSFWFYLRYENFSQKSADENQFAVRRWRDHAALWYGFSLVAFVLALLSKTSTVMLPMVLLGCAFWQRGKITRQDFLQISPFLFLSLAFGLMSAWFQKHQALAMAGQTLQPESFLQKLVGAGRDFWFYLGKAILPVNLSIVYARWKLDATTLAAFLPVLFLCAGFILCWRFRHKWGRHILFGLGCFFVTLFPALGFFDSQFLTMWQVSDHLQYLPLIAPVTLAVAGLAFLLDAKMFRVAGAILILAFSILTFQRAQVFADEESLFRDTLAKNPAASDAHNDLGVILAKRQDYAGATAHFSAAVQSDPNNANAHSNLGQALAMNGNFAEAEPHLLAAISLNPADPLAHKRFADALNRQGKIQQAVVQMQVALSLSAKSDVQTRLDLAGLLFQTGNSRQAADQFRKVLSANSNLPEPLNNLAWILATASDDAVRDGIEAVQHAELACQLTSFKQTAMVSTLAAAYAEAGRFPEAVATAEMAIRLANANGETHFAEINNQLLPLYRAGLPYHEKPAANKIP
jgi:tetratricopeptide (TPR) repeat protein